MVVDQPRFQEMDPWLAEPRSKFSKLQKQTVTAVHGVDQMIFLLNLNCFVYTEYYIVGHHFRKVKILLSGASFCSGCHSLINISDYRLDFSKRKNGGFRKSTTCYVLHKKSSKPDVLPYLHFSSERCWILLITSSLRSHNTNIATSVLIAGYHTCALKWRCMKVNLLNFTTII